MQCCGKNIVYGKHVLITATGQYSYCFVITSNSERILSYYVFPLDAVFFFPVNESVLRIH